MATSTPGKPNILFVMADDVGWFNVGAYHRGMMAGRTPNLDRLAAEGMMFHNGSAADTHRSDDRRAGGCCHRHAGASADHCHGP
jgi:hypothetical protein